MLGRIARWRPVSGVLAALSVALTGTFVSSIALPWYVLVTTGSAGWTGVVAFCEMAPYVAAKAFSGPLVDRLGPRRVSRVADVFSALAVALVPLLHVLDALPMWGLLVVVALIGLTRGPGDLAKRVMIPEAARRSGLPLERATGLAGVTERLALTVGPAAGGALVAWVGPLPALVLNAVCFALGWLVVTVVVPRDMGAPAEEPATPEDDIGYWRRLAEGFAFLRRDRLLMVIAALIAVINLLDSAMAAVLMPVWARESGNGPAALGLLVAVMGAGAILGSLVITAIGHRLGRRLVFFAGLLTVGAPRFLVLALDAHLGVALAVFAVAGFGSGFLNPVLTAVIFERIPPHLLGRVGGLLDALAWIGIPFGGLLAGAAVTAFGWAPALAVAGGIYLAATLLAGLRPEWREMDRERAGADKASDKASVEEAVGAAPPPVPGAPGAVAPPTGGTDRRSPAPVGEP
ncbi:MFS transporter [Streptomyces calidiresistens]|uniref:Multidrug efflux pump Tap n=1 Tax=Streptomyces calidiresistens TaxID=1485586 RepID=A0A7W3XYW9_9ACTN|nr:MFS transporter [Streptomyces calidiresistens]MBB0232251.1 MFS transporter [Streptomyces calidiresistens]